MNHPFKKNAKIVLSNGITFSGYSFGALGSTVGEIVFNTGMTGYQEVITDPSYFGQILTFTYPEIGNTGINFEDSESDKYVKGLIVRNYSRNSSNWRSKQDLNQWLIDNKIVGIYRVDTRALVSYIRDNGAMNAVISTEIDYIDDLKKQLAKIPSMDGLELASKVSTKQPYFYGEENAKYKIAALDLGIK